MNNNFKNEFDKVKHLLQPAFDLDSAFKNKEFNDIKLDIIEIGEINLKSGKIIACDPFAFAEDNIKEFLQTVKPNKYKLELLVIEDEERYCAVKVSFSNKNAKRYEIAVIGEENLSEIEENDFFGYSVDSGMGCIADIEAFKEYIKLINKYEKLTYDEYFSNLLEENAKLNPKYQSRCGDWLNWSIENTDLNIIMFQSGYGDGVYPSYFAFDENDEICAFYTVFIDLNDYE